MSHASVPEDLILAAQTGEAAALARLLASCQTDARRYARRHCHASDVDDAVQESLLTITRHLSGLKFAMAFSSWLFTVVRHQCLRMGRKLAVHEPLDDQLTERQLSERSDQALQLDLIRALEALPPHYLEVVLLRDFEELTIQEMAFRLNETDSTVKSRLHRARQLVRQHLLA